MPIGGKPHPRWPGYAAYVARVRAMPQRAHQVPRRRSNDDQPIYVGQCGRSPDEPCGMKDVRLCSIHAQQLNAPPDDDGPADHSERAVLLREIRAIRKKAMASQTRSLDQRQREVEGRVGPRHAADLFREIAAERTRAAERRVGKAQLVAADSAFRLGGW